MGSEASSPRGLGRGLAGILGDTRDSKNAPEVSSLLGDRELRKDPTVRRLVTDLALNALADLFGSEVVFIVRKDSDATAPNVACRVPGNWRPDDPVSFEVNGRLWSSLSTSGDGSTSSVQTSVIDDGHLLISQHTSGGTVMAGAVLRPQAFSDADQRIVASLVGSVARALDHRSAVPDGSSIRLVTSETANGVLADIRIADPRGRRHATSVAPDPLRAIAHAGAELCEPAVDVRFAGQADVEGRSVVLVVIDQEDGGPLLGLAIGDRSSSTLPAEAVFAAAGVVGASPFSGEPQRTPSLECL